jgi:hypothetical protein
MRPRRQMGKVVYGAVVFSLHGGALSGCTELSSPEQ